MGYWVHDGICSSLVAYDQFIDPRKGLQDGEDGITQATLDVELPHFRKRGRWSTDMHPIRELHVEDRQAREGGQDSKKWSNVEVYIVPYSEI